MHLLPGLLGWLITIFPYDGGLWLSSQNRSGASSGLPDFSGASNAVPAAALSVLIFFAYLVADAWHDSPARRRALPWVSAEAIRVPNLPHACLSRPCLAEADRARTACSRSAVLALSLGAIRRPIGTPTTAA